MTQTRFILAGNFIDGSGAAVRKNVYLEVQNGRIVDIGAAAELSRSGKAISDDFSHCTILPALVDCSVSLLQSPALDERTRLFLESADLKKKAAVMKRHTGYCHAHGVLGVAANGKTLDLPEYPQINIRTSGHLQGQRQEGPAILPAEADFLRISYSPDIENDNVPSPGLSHNDLRRILQSRNGKKAVVVANGPQEVKEALAAGCDAIEQGYGMGEANLREMARKNVLFIPSVLRARNALDGSAAGGDVCCRFSHRYAAPGKPRPQAEAFWKKMFAQHLKLLHRARELGVPAAIGTGAGSVGILHGESMVEEMKLFIKAGYSLSETVRCASETGARFFGMDEIGALTVGRKATFLITRGTVLQLPRKLSYLEGIYIDGAPSAFYRKNPVKSVR